MEPLHERLEGLAEVAKSMVRWLRGRKTYFMAVGLVAVEVAFLTGKIDAQQRESLQTLFGTGALATFAAKLNRYNEIAKQMKNLKLRDTK